jgi:crotonobetainyl-CoA:carnitine CoA-transferase CaiB-like acyl-CoA transferase
VAVEKIFMSRTREEWQEKLSALDACCEPVLDIDEVAAHPQIAARSVIHGGEVRPGVVLRDDWKRLDAPRLGEHSAEVLAEVGVDATEFVSLRDEGVTAQPSP